MVPGAGIEPARPLSRGILSPLRLPISPPGHTFRKQKRIINDELHGIVRLEAGAGIEPASTALQAAA